MGVLSTVHVEIPSGSTWTPVTLDGATSITVQNTAEVLMEYSFTDGIVKGSYLTPYTFISGVRQTVYVRFYNSAQNGTISVTKEA